MISPQQGWTLESHKILSIKPLRDWNTPNSLIFNTSVQCPKVYGWTHCDFWCLVFQACLSTMLMLCIPLFLGQERFGNMTRVYYKEAVGAFVVFDVTRSPTFEAVTKWKHDLDSKVKLANGNPIPAVLLANKCDQKKENSNNTSLMDDFCKEAGFLGWFETSAKVSLTLYFALFLSWCRESCRFKKYWGINRLMCSLFFKKKWELLA